MAHLHFDESATSQKIYMDRQFFSKFEDQVRMLAARPRATSFSRRSRERA
jgi:hypothetical protein